MSDPGGAAVSSPQGPGGSQARTLGGSAAQAAVGRPPLCKGENPISEVLQAGQDELGAGAGAVAVTVTPGELRHARVIGQVGESVVELLGNAPHSKYIPGIWAQT